MNSEVYSPEQAISGFTLALLEDSGWYKTNDYTGGLMRFGKNQGCDFLNKDCEVKDNSKNKFKNDLFTVNNIFSSTCSSGRQSRTYNYGTFYAYRGIQQSGKSIADYCFVSYFDNDEENNMFYVGNCNKGGGDYGNRVFYNGQKIKNGNLPGIFGEKYSGNSFCALSSVVPLGNYQSYSGITHSMCYEMFCSKKSLTIKIYNQYVVCPRSGGIVAITGNYKGYLYCPDYNLICTGSVICNDMFECVEKKSSEKSDTFNYDYTIKTSQEIIEESDLTETDISIGYELEDDGKCPEHCSQCKENKKCFECEERFILIGSKEDDNNPIICDDENRELPNYYKNENDNTYYLCMDNCLNCNDKNTCNNCDLKYKLNLDKTNCEEKIPHCKNFDTNYIYCIECNDQYYLLNDDNTHCHNETIDNEKHFTEDGGKTYISCDKAIENCIKCENRNYCTLCNNGYKLENENKECNIKIPNCKKFDITYEYCEECDEGYYLLNDDKTQCHNEPIDNEKHFTEDGGKTYISCDQAIPNCLKCKGKNSCTQCLETYKIEQNGAICNPKVPNCKIYEDNNEYCQECEENYYLINNDKTHCYNEPIDNEKYFTEDGGKKYISCDQAIPNCLKCEGRDNCIKCKDGYIFEDSNLCSLIYDSSIECKININNIDDNDISFLNEENINNLVKQYYQNNENRGKVEHYINNIYNYTITIFKMDECTKNLLPIGDYYIDTKNILSLYNNGYFINCFISYNYKNYINFYKSGNGEKINMEEKCPECLKLNYRINNNFTNELLNHYSPLIIEKIKEENIDIFSKENDILNNKCDSFEVGGINLPIEIREKIFYNNDNYEGIICTDSNCKINTKNMEELTSDCDCKINNEFNYLLDNINNLNNNVKKNQDNDEEYVSSEASINPGDIFSCFFKNLSSEKFLQTFGFYFSIGCVVIEIISFVSYVAFKQNINIEKYQKKENKDNKDYKEQKNNDDKNDINDINENKISDKNTQQLETPDKNISIPTDGNQEPDLVSMEVDNYPSNPPPRNSRNSILYKYKWFKNKPKVLSLENSHDEDLDVQSRDEADPQNEIRRKIKQFSFLDKNSSCQSSAIDDDDDDFSSVYKKSESSKNKMTLVTDEKTKKIFNKIEDNKEEEDKEFSNIKSKKDIEIMEISSKKEEPIQTLKINLPQVLTREENARRKRKKKHSIKNTQQQPKDITYPNKKIEEKIIKKPTQIYIEVLFIKQHIINFFSCLFNNKLEFESFIPLQMKIIRFIFLIILNMFFNTILISQNYFLEKYNYFDNKYNLDQITDINFKISTGDKVKYSFSHCFKNALISFILCLIIQLIIGLIFFGTKKKIDEIIENKEKKVEEKDYTVLMSKIKTLFIIFFIINFVLLIILGFYIIGFNMVYKGSESDFLIPTFITFILLQIMPFIISLIITLIMYYGFKNNNKNQINIAKTFLF